MSYTEAALLAVAACVVLDLLVLRTRLLRTRAFWLSYAVVLGFQVLTNGVLAGAGVVGYSADAVAGTGSAPGERPPFVGEGRVAFAPFEDLLFGFSLVVQTLVWWTHWGRVRPAAS